jgi:hypothetical protein
LEELLPEGARLGRQARLKLQINNRLAEHLQTLHHVEPNLGQKLNPFASVKSNPVQYPHLLKQRAFARLAGALLASPQRRHWRQ